MRRLARLASLVLLTACGLACLTPAAHAQPAARRTVVLVSVPGLMWSDVRVMPNLAAIAGQSAVGELSVKTRGGTTRCAAGMLAVSAGNRTSAPVGSCDLDMSTWPMLRRINAKTRYDARIGGVGDALLRAHVQRVAVTAIATPPLADHDGAVDVVTPTLSQALKAGGVISVMDDELYDVPLKLRSIGQADVDARLAAIRRAVPPTDDLIIAGISDTKRFHARLHAIIISGPGWRHTELRSSAAGRAPFVQLIDLGPTVLSLAGVPIPSFMVGEVMQQSGSSVPAISSYVDDDKHAVKQRTLGQRVFLVLGIAAILMMLLAWAPIGIGRVAARYVARLLAPAPAIVFLANALPWWRWGQPAYAAIVVGGCIVLATATTVARRHSVTAAVLVVPIFSVVVLCGDQLNGAGLQISAPLGDSPLIAGRFNGMGNLDFAIMSTSALIIAGVLGARLDRRRAILVAGTVAFVALIIDGAPQLGNDIGGVLSLLPAGIVVVALVAQVRITRRRALAVGLTTVLVAVLVALADYSRPASHQTHVGRFVGQVLHGGANTEVRRKLDSALASFGLTIGTFVVGVALLLALLSYQRIRRTLASSTGLTAAAVSATVGAVLGVALNDSGVTIAAMALIVGLSAIYGAGLVSPVDQPEPAAGG